jgi:Bacterial mobilisation protein (MobC)
MRKRPRVVAVRLTNTEADAVQLAANRHALSPGQYLRACALHDAAPALPIPRARRPPPADAGLLAEIAAHLGRIGGNLNQIAHVANRGLESAKNELDTIERDLRAMRDLLASALGIRSNP